MFRGADASLIKLDNKVVAHVELDMQRKPSKAAPPLELPKLDDIPLFNLFGGGQKALQPKEKDRRRSPLPKSYRRHCRRYHRRDARPKGREF